ncbi:MAG: nicotinate-nucleotide adenylyltransferase [Acidimicrobiales bacterium]
MNAFAERIGVLGGTFDPVHVGHLAAAVNARHSLRLDRVLLVVSNEPWQKVGLRPVTPAELRFELVRAAAEEVPGLEASRMEIDRGGPSFTADTLVELAKENPGAELFLIVGADAAADISSWERVEVVRELSTLVVVNRPRTRLEELPGGFRACAVEIPALDISSTDLRQRAADGRPLDFLVPAAAIRALARMGLYSVGG